MLIGSLIPKTDFSQLLHIFDLVEDYQLHKKMADQDGEEFCLVEFVIGHIFPCEEHDLHDTDQQNLPCQSPHVSVLLFISDVPTKKSDISFSTFLNELSFQNNFHLTGFIKSLIQPPSFS